jgi:acetyltransferase-like isoleucine patch superfamily enzyme
LQNVNYNVEKYIKILIDSFGEEKVILVKPRLATNCIDNEHIIYTPNFKISGNINAMIDNIYSYLSKEYIPSPSTVIGNSNCLSPFEFHFNQGYYEYLFACFNETTKGRFSHKDVFDLLKDEYETKTKIEYSQVFYKQILDKLKTKIEKRIVFVGEDYGFKEQIKIRYNKEILVHIVYNSNSNMEKIAEEIEVLKKENKDVVFIVPEIYPSEKNKGLMAIFYNLSLIYGSDYIMPNYEQITLNNFIGFHQDIYNNSFSIQSKSDIVFYGAAIIVNIEKGTLSPKINIKIAGNLKIGPNCRLQDVKIRVWYESIMEIGEGTEIVAAEIISASFGSTIIGKDCLMSSQIRINCGDGHPIFQISTDQNERTYTLMNDCQKDSIIIGDHVWVGYGCVFLSGTEIGNGSLIGACSLINKKFPNNVAVVGIPGKIIRKNIAWCRNVLVKEINRDKEVMENYANITIIE